MIEYTMWTQDSDEISERRGRGAWRRNRQLGVWECSCTTNCAALHNNWDRRYFRRRDRRCFSKVRTLARTKSWCCGRWKWAKVGSYGRKYEWAIGCLQPRKGTNIVIGKTLGLCRVFLFFNLRDHSDSMVTFPMTEIWTLALCGDGQTLHIYIYKIVLHA